MGKKQETYRQAMRDIKLSDGQKQELLQAMTTIRRNGKKAWQLHMASGLCVAVCCALIGIFVWKGQDWVSPLTLRPTETFTGDVRDIDLESEDWNSVALYNGETTDETDTFALPGIIDDGISYYQYPSKMRQSSSQEILALSRDFVMQDSLQQFASTVLPQLLSSAEGEENLSCSPLSIYMAFSVLAECSDSEVQEELLPVLGVENVSVLCEQTELMTKIFWRDNYGKEETAEGSLSIPGLVDSYASYLQFANSIWIDDIFAKMLVPSAKELFAAMADPYRLTVVVGDLQSEQMGQKKGEWLRENTNGLLGHNPESNSFSSDEVLCIINTLYFKDYWQNPFREELDTEAIFTQSNGTQQKVTFMNQTLKSDRYGYGEASAYLKLDYSGSGSYMLLFLPEEGTDPVDALIQDLPDAISMAEQEASSQILPEIVQIHLSLPSFEVTSRVNICDILSALGMECLLNGGLMDHLFSGVTDINMLDIIQEVKVKVDHHGTEAAAYTALIYGSNAKIPEKELYFEFNRPFAYAIVERGTVLFAGVVNQIEQ